MAFEKSQYSFSALGTSWHPQTWIASGTGVHYLFNDLTFPNAVFLQTVVVFNESPHIYYQQFQQDTVWNGSTVKEQALPPFELVQYTAGPLSISPFHNTPVWEKEFVSCLCWLVGVLFGFVCEVFCFCRVFLAFCLFWRVFLFVFFVHLFLRFLWGFFGWVFLGGRLFCFLKKNS